MNVGQGAVTRWRCNTQSVRGLGRESNKRGQWNPFACNKIGVFAAHFNMCIIYKHKSHRETNYPILTDIWDSEWSYSYVNSGGKFEFGPVGKMSWWDFVLVGKYSTVAVHLVFPSVATASTCSWVSAFSIHNQRKVNNSDAGPPLESSIWRTYDENITERNIYFTVSNSWEAI